MKITFENDNDEVWEVFLKECFTPESQYLLVSPGEKIQTDVVTETQVVAKRTDVNAVRKIA